MSEIPAYLDPWVKAANEQSRKDMACEIAMQPWSPTAEKGVLGAILLSEMMASRVRAIVAPDDFYDPRHSKIYEMMCQIADDAKPVDAMELILALEDKGLLEKCGGPAYILKLPDECISPGNAVHHARHIRDHATKRKTIELGIHTQESAQSGFDELEPLLESIKTDAEKLLERQAETSCISTRQMAQEAIDGIIAGTERTEIEYATGLHVLDDATGGLHRSQLTVVGGRPSEGKSALAINLAENHCKRNGGVIFFSLEMSATEVFQRLASSELGIDGTYIRDSKLHEHQIIQIQKFGEHIGEHWNLKMSSDSKPDMAAIRAQCEQTIRGNPGTAWLVIIDYLQLVATPYRAGRSRENEVSGISGGCKELAMSLNVPVVALSQLRRPQPGKEKVPPKLSDLRESGSLEQDAHNVFLLHKVLDGNENNHNFAHVELQIAKQRNGPAGRTIHLGFHSKLTKFVQREIEQVGLGR